METSYEYLQKHTGKLFKPRYQKHNRDYFLLLGVYIKHSVECFSVNQINYIHLICLYPATIIDFNRAVVGSPWDKEGWAKAEWILIE